MNIISYSWGNKNIGEGDEILLSPMEHHSNLIPWQELARTKGAKIKFLSLNIDGTLDLSNIDELITQKTKLVSIVHVSNALGTINPVKELCEKAHSTAEIIIAKQRHGPIGTIKTHFESNYTKFSDLNKRDYETIIE